MKRYLIAGLLVWVPLGITLWVLHFLLTTLDQILLVLPEQRAAAKRSSASTSPVSAWWSRSASCWSPVSSPPISSASG